MPRQFNGEWKVFSIHALIIHVKKNKQQSLLPIIQKTNSKCIPQLNVKPETMKLLGKGRKKIETLGQARIFKIGHQKH